jgi:transcriptional regulator with XRE-family HTH domain
MLRSWRSHRRMSQLELSSRGGVSTRHLSYVENDKARPSRELLVHLAHQLDIPHRATNDLLLAAGFAPVYSELALDDEAVAAAREAVALILRGNEPHPTTVIDTRWNLLDANQAALWLTDGVAAHLLEPPINVARLSLHPDGLAPRVTNLADYATHLLGHMRRVLDATRDPELADLVSELDHYRPAIRRERSHGGALLPLQIVVDGVELSFLSTATTFGTAYDVTLSELTIETLYPADATTSARLAARPWTTRRDEQGRDG